jgi:spore maturation protein CgeB
MPGYECMAYKSVDHLIADCKFLNEHPQEAINIAIEGRNKILNDHLYNHRAQTMLGIINA